MLGKLFKHDLIDLFKKSILLFAVVIGLSLLMFLFGKLGETSSFFLLVHQFFQIGYWLSIAGIIIYSVFYPIRRFYKSMLKDEGYLTHTLPVKTSHILFSKLTCAFLLFIATIFIVILSLMLIEVIKFVDLKNMIEALNSDFVVVFIMVILYLIVYYYGNVMLFITSLTIGHSSSSRKGAMSIVTGIIIYTIQQVLGMISLGLLFLVNVNFLEDIVQGEASILLILIVPMIMSLLLVVAEIIVTNYFLNKKLNLE